MKTKKFISIIITLIVSRFSAGYSTVSHFNHNVDNNFLDLHDFIDDENNHADDNSDDSEEDEHSPQTYLEQNIPNPFAELTFIPYSIAEKGKVKITIMNENHKLIRTFINENCNTGTHILKWNSTNELGNNVSPGKYILRMNTIDYSGTIIMNKAK